MKIAFCTKEGEPDWTEQLLTDNEAQLPQAIKWAESNGYRVRVAEIDLTVTPDWSKTLSV